MLAPAVRRDSCYMLAPAVRRDSCYMLAPAVRRDSCYMLVPAVRRDKCVGPDIRADTRPECRPGPDAGQLHEGGAGSGRGRARRISKRGGGGAAQQELEVARGVADGRGGSAAEAALREVQVRHPARSTRVISILLSESGHIPVRVTLLLLEPVCVPIRVS